MRAVYKRKKHHFTDGAEGQLTIDMGKQIATARGFPLQVLAKAFLPHRQEQQIRSASKVFLRRGANLMHG